MKRRQVSPFSLSFLDIMFCGFGAVALLVLILNTNTEQERNEIFADMRSEVVRMENEVLVGRENMVIARNSLEATEKGIVLMQGQARQVQQSLLEIEAGLTDLNAETLARKEHINRLKADIQGLDKTTQDLAAKQQTENRQGNKVHQFTGEGNRQYLTGLKLSGKRTLILLDVSASMLEETIVNIIRLRHMSDERKQAAEKWKRAQGTAEWLISNLPEDTRFQVYLFNTLASSAMPLKKGAWLSASRPEEVAASVKGVREAVPAGGTSLFHAFAAARTLSPKPDNILLITDGLPTQGQKKPTATTVSSKQRLKLFERAIRELPAGVPVNTILLPMEGDAYAAAAFWQLAVNTTGSFGPGEGLAMSSRKQRRQVDIFNLSFLDVVSCGFGAIILLLIIVRFSDPVVIEKLSVDLSGQVLNLERQLHEIREETTILNRELTEKQEQLSIHREKLARLRGSLSVIEGEFAEARADAETQAIIEGRLQVAQQTLSEEMRRLQQGALRRPEVNNRIGGVPVDSEYVIFIIDTSGSMAQYAWAHVLKKVSEVLRVYPKVKGIQVMNDMGQFMFQSYGAKWIPDTPGRRAAINQRLRTWQPFSNSSPVEGIEAAIRRFYAKDKRISLYVFGDDFSSGSIEKVLNTVESLNRADSSGKHMVRIHAIGFPVMFTMGGMDSNAVRFAALMRKLAENNDGTFVGLNSNRP